MNAQITKLTAEQIRAQGFRIVLGQDAVPRGPDGRLYWPHHRVMVGMEYYPAGEVRNTLAKAIEADRKRKRSGTRQRKTRGGDPLNLKGREFTTPAR